MCAGSLDAYLPRLQSRISLRAYPSPKDFDVDLSRLFEKGRRWFEEGGRDYGRILILQARSSSL